MSRKIKLFCGMILLTVFIMLAPRDVEATSPTRVINVVYDDSGSMIQINGKTVDTWCQAKYSMEVFASMLSENDTMNVYVMSDYMYSMDAAPRLVLNGSSGAEENVKKVHEMLTKAIDTPFTSVQKAYSDLAKTSADEKWLVVLTDGEFDEFLVEKDAGKEKIDAYFGEKEDDIKIMFFGMGANAAKITKDEENNIFYETAKDNNEILKKITQICTRVFNSHRLEVNDKNKEISFDVPMAQLIIFAQGSQVEIGNLKNGKEDIQYSNIVSVRYSEKPATNYSNFIVADNLVGKVATFNGDFSSGEYKIDVSGAETVEVYYKPNVAIAAYLKNSDGEEVTNIEELETGDYTIEFGFIRAGTNEIVPESKLLGDIKYKAVVTNNGTVHDKMYDSGDSIHLEEGELSIDATAYFLDYNTVSTSMNYTIYKNKGISFSVESNPKYRVTSKGFKEEEPIVVKVTLDGQDFSSEQWEALEVPKVELGKKLKEEDGGVLAFFNIFRKFNTIDEVVVEKTDEPGILHLKPTIKKNNPKNGTYVGTEYILEIYSQDGKAVWDGKMDGKIKIVDIRNLFEREMATVIRLVVAGCIGFILLGFTPLFKKRFPKSMKESPAIECKPLPFGKTTTTKGRFTKDTASVWLPFVPEKGTLRFVPGGTSGVPSMKLKAAGGSKMVIMNTVSFADKSMISIDGESVPKDQKKMLNKTPSMTIEVKTPSVRYTCTPRF